jgi:glycosyltransferase involved in cell wall biosynthesis
METNKKTGSEVVPNPLVSIIIPIYNSEEYIYDTVTSCLNQSYSNLEIILVNDGSTDGTEDVLMSLIIDQRVSYHKIENCGACNARNFGISQATGTLYQFLDHDDLIAFDKIENQVNKYLRNGSSYIYSSRMGTVSGNSKVLDPGYELYEKDFTPEQYFTTILNQFGKYITTGAWLIPVEIVNTTHGWDDRAGLNDDGEYFMRLILNSSGIKFCEDASFFFRRDVPNSLSKQFSSKVVYEKWLYSYKSYSDNFQMKFEQKLAKSLGRKALSVYYCNSYPHYPDLSRQCKDYIKELGYDSPLIHGGSRIQVLARFVGVENALKIAELKNMVINFLGLTNAKADD